MSNSSFYSTTGATSNQEDAIEASVNNAAASETAAAASSATSTAQATISTDKAAESAASAAAALVSKNSAESSSTSANTSKNSASVSASAASSSASAASGSASTASTKAAQALSSSNSSSSSASTSSTARDASIAAKNSSVTAQGLSEAARDASIVAKDASVVAKTSSETAATNAAASSTTSTTKANESAASAAAALSSKNSSDTNSATATTKASEAASSATASAASATASAASATTSTASKDTAVAVTANFLGAHSSAPTATASGGALAVGMLYFDTTSDVLKVRASGGWINAGSSVNGTSARFAYTLTANQTTVSGNDTSGNALAYDSGFADVYLNGVKLAAADFTATSGSSIVLAAGATANDILEVVAFGTFQLSNGTFAGTTTVNNLTITGTTTAPTQAESDDSTKIATTAYVVDKITTLIGGAPSTLSDLNELAAAINDDANYNSTLTTALGTKMPKSGGAFTGAVTTNSTFDGVDIATRDAVLTSTTTTANAALPKAGGALTGDVTFGNNNKAIFGSGSALKLYHSGSSSILDNTSGGLFFNQWVDNADITFQNDDSTGGTTTYMLMQGSTGEVQLKHYGSTKISTKAAGVEVAGNMVVSGTVDGVDIAARDAVLTSTTTTANAALPKSGGTMTGTLDATTSAQDAYFFKGSHSSSTNFYITNTNATTGNAANLFLAPANNVAGAYLSAIATEDFSVAGNRTADLAFYTRKDGTFGERLRIDSSGNVGIGSGSLDSLMARTAQGYLSTRVNNFNITSGSSAYAFTGVNIYQDANGAYKYIDTGASSSIHYWGGDIQFHTATSGSADATQSSTEKMRIDSSGNVGIGVSPAAISNYRVLQTQGTNGTVFDLGASGKYSRIISDTNGLGFEVTAGSHANQNIRWKAGTISGATDSHMILNSSGQVGIGCVPANTLHLVGSSATPSLRLGSTSLNYFWDIGRENQTTGDFLIGNAQNSTSATNRLRISNAGIVTTPSQPAFSAFLNSSTASNAYSASTVHRVPFASNHFDQGSNFNSSDYMFHCPTGGAGVYLFTANVLLTGVSTTSTNCEVSLRHEDHNTYYGSRVDAVTGWGDGFISLSVTQNIKLDDGDRVSVKVYCTEIFGFYGSSLGSSNYFSGVKVT